MTREDRCKVQRISPTQNGVVRLYLTHLGYLHALRTILGCVHAAIVGEDVSCACSSESELRNRLFAMVIHLRDRRECVNCCGGMLAEEAALLDLLTKYMESDHFKSAMNYALIAVHVPAVSDASDGDEAGDLHLLGAWYAMINEKMVARSSLAGRELALANLN